MSMVAINKEEVKSVFQLHNSQYKINTASVYQTFSFPARSNQSFWKYKGHLNGAIEANYEPWELMTLANKEQYRCVDMLTWTISCHNKEI